MAIVKATAMGKAIVTQTVKEMAIRTAKEIATTTDKATAIRMDKEIIMEMAVTRITAEVTAMVAATTGPNHK
jgi:uncharacterized protein (DUF1786 family)